MNHANKLLRELRNVLQGKKEFPRDIQFIAGMGVFMEEFRSSLRKRDIDPQWIGIPGRSLRSLQPDSLDVTLHEIENLL